MFTGIVQAVSRVESISHGRLVVAIPSALSSVAEGESIAVNGCCLTTTRTGALAFQLSPETLARTNLSELAAGSAVNLERAATLATLFGGHVVQGHVDATGRVEQIEQRENALVIRFAAPEEYQRYLIDKGSITVDGVSLTVVCPEGVYFETWIIPHTRQHTNLGSRRLGDRVNLEFDVIAKYVERLLVR